MKNVIILLTVLLFITGCKKDSSSEPATAPDDGTKYTIKTIQEGELTIYNIDSEGITIVKIPRISSYIYNKLPQKSIESVAVDSSYLLVINASFYDRLTEGCKHSGYLKINGVKYEDKKRDYQLNRLFAYDSKKNIVRNYSVDELDSTENYDLVFQTGPQIILKGKIDSASIDESINGNEYKIRTAFAVVNDKDFYVIISRLEVTLKNLGKMLLDFDIFKGEVNVINFDGGPSTVLYIKNQPNSNFGITKTLPLLIGVK